MINDQHNNSGCGKAAQLVSYLYGEMSAAEIAGFENHLSKCSLCADELQAFSGVHFAISDWKTMDFADLPTPRIEIPYPPTPEKEAVSNKEKSWLSGFGKLFALSPKWSPAAAAMAILAVCAGVVWLASNSQIGGKDVAEKNVNAKTQTSPTAEKPTEPSNAENRQKALPETESKTADDAQAPEPELVVERNPKRKRAVKAANPQRLTKKAETTNLPKNDTATRDNQKNKKIAPKIFEDEEEDETLRLAEMFDEIDTIE